MTQNNLRKKGFWTKWERTQPCEDMKVGKVVVTSERSKQGPEQVGSCCGGIFGFYSKYNEKPLQTL